MSWSIAGLEELDDKQGVDRVEIHGVEEAITVFNTTYPDLDLSLFSSCQEDILLPPILRDFLHDLEQGLGDLPTQVEETDKILKVDGGSSQELFQRKQALLWSGSNHQEQQHVAEESCLGSSTFHPVLGRAERLNKTAHEDHGDTLVDSSVSEAPKASEVHRDVDDDHDLVHQVQVKQDSAKSVSVGPRHVSHHEAEAPEGPREGPHWVGGVRACDVSQAGWLLGHQSVQDGAEVVIEFVRNEKNKMEFGVTELEQEEERAGQAHRQVHMVPRQLTGDHGQLQVFIVLLTTITNQELQRLRYNLQVKMSEMIVNTDTAYLYTGDRKHLVKDDNLKSVNIAIPFQYNGWSGDSDSDYHHHPSEAVGLQSTGPQHDSRLEHQVEQGPLGLRDNLQVKVLKIKENTDTAYLYTGQNAPNIVLASNIARVVKIHMHNREQGLTVVIRNDIHSALHSTEHELHCGLQSMESHEVGQDGHSPVQNGQQGGVVCHTGQPQVVVHCPGEVGGHCHGEPRAYVHVGPLVGHHGVQVGLHQVREVQASPEDLHVVRLSAGDLRSHIQGPSVHRDGAPVDGLQCGDLSGDVGTVGAVEKGGGLVLQLKHPKSQGEPVTESVCPYVELFRPDIGLGQSEATAVLLSATEGQAPQIKRVHEIVYTNKEMEQVIAGEQGRQVHTALLNNLLCCHEPLQLAVQEPQRLSLRDHLQS